MKKNGIVSLLCLMLLLFAALLPAARADTITAWVKTPNGGSVALREKPTTGSKELGRLDYRTQVIVYGYENGWALLEPADWSRSNPAYMKASYLVYSDPGPYRKSKPTPKPTARPTAAPADGPTYKEVDDALRELELLVCPYPAVIKANRPTNYVHLRWIPCTSSRYIAQYLPGEPVTVLAESKKWAQVQIDESGCVGFILKNNVDPVDVEALAAIAE